MKHHERRRHPRGEVHGSAIVLVNDRYVGNFLVRNVSQGGALLVGHAQLETGTEVRALLQMLGGSIMSMRATIVRHEEHGDERTFALQFVGVAANDENEIAKLVATADKGRPTVLVVEESAQLRDVLVRDLRALGYAPLTAETPLNAISHLYNEVPVVAVIADMTRNGTELLAFLKSEAPAVRRVLTVTEVWAGKALPAIEAQAVLQQPWNLESLAAVLDLPEASEDLAHTLNRNPL